MCKIFPVSVLLFAFQRLVACLLFVKIENAFLRYLFNPLTVMLYSSPENCPCIILDSSIYSLV